MIKFYHVPLEEWNATLRYQILILSSDHLLNDKRVLYQVWNTVTKPVFIPYAYILS